MKKHAPKYIKPAEPQWTVDEEVRQLMVLLHAAKMQADMLIGRVGGLPKKRINDMGTYLDNSEKWIRNTFAKGKAAEAADYAENEAAAVWEVVNELRKADDKGVFLAACYGFTAGALVDADSGKPMNQLTAEEAQQNWSEAAQAEGETAVVGPYIGLNEQEIRTLENMAS
ncbi:hypothetical protein [Hymenobacter sp. BT491]|uniref:hypothetical protein n=1 Tax=Hymenobacter sp. BT491 TaxID=2766779 RepID=UPI001653E0EB|nr:hypothetical protein [Hymenobacter sp. BT491]MBC6988547.1 hypothetical protein [Hymenobacter sp. BT491]